MAADEQVLCAMCGFQNQAGAKRCVSCGAKLDLVLADNLTEAEIAARRYQQENFEWKWALLSLATFIVVQGIVLVGLPLVVGTFDPIGISGAVASAAIWFIGGIAIALVTPGKTFVEPAVGALIAIGPTIAFLSIVTPDGLGASILAYVIVGLLGAMCSLFGAFIGEKLSGDPV